MLSEASAHFYKHWKMITKRPGDLSVILLYPVISILSLGIFAYFISLRGSPPETMIFVLVGVIVWDIYNVAERYGSYSLMLDIWNDSVKHTFAGSSSFWGYIIGNMLFGLFGSVIVFILISAIGIVLFGFSIFSAGFFLINFIPIYIFGMSFGIIVGALMLLKGEKYMSLIWITPGIIMVFSGIYYPVNLLPAPVQAVSMAIPSTHSLISLRSAVGFVPELAVPEMVIGFVLSGAYLLISLYLFRWSIKRSKETGMMVKY